MSFTIENLEEIVDRYYHLKETEESKKIQNIKKVVDELRIRFDVAHLVKKEQDKFLASDFNLIGFFEPGENKISDIIAELLNPEGKHGQGETFLAKFLDVTNTLLGVSKFSDLPNLDDIEIERE